MNKNTAQTRSGAEIFADALSVNGVEFVYHVPAESFLSILDALARHHTGIKLVSCRHEGGMAFMADAYGKLTGRPAVCLVTRGPGATNACLGVHTAYQDSSPMVFCVGQAGRQQMERDAFLEYDFRSMFRPMAKWVAHVDDPARLPEFVNRAFHTAMSGRMGPVVLVLPDDVQDATADVADLPASVPTMSHPAPTQITRMGELLASARRPIMLVGGEGWTTAARDQVQQFASRNHVPIVAAFRRRDIIDNRHVCYAGELGIGASPKLLERIQEADLIIALGSRLSEMDTIGAGIMNGFTLLQAPKPEAALIHVYPSVEQLNRVYQPDLAILSGVVPFAGMLADLEPVAAPAWRDWSASLRTDYEEYITTDMCPGPVDLPEIFRWLRQRLPADSILTNGSGTYAGWSQRYFQHYQPHTQIGPTSGAMGYGLPAAIAAKLHRPQVPVIALAGDGCFLMNGEELATAMKYDVPIIILVINNGMYGAILLHQEMHYQGRAVGTDLVNPDFAAYAQAFGAHGEVVCATAEFAAAFERSVASGRPALIELRINPDAINTRFTLSSLRQKS
jgi:acetolactate synthase-1/2/3 large subunit